MIARNHRDASRHEQISRLGRFQGATECVAAVDDVIDAFAVNIGEHGL